MAVKYVGQTDLSWIFSKIKSVFIKKDDTLPVEAVSVVELQSVTVDNAPTANSDNLVKSGGVYDAIHPAVETTQPAGGFAPNIVYDLGTLTGSVTFSLATPSDANIANAYHWTFDTGATAPTITWPTGLVWADGSAPTVADNKHYEVMIRGHYATAIEFDIYTAPGA